MSEFRSLTSAEQIALHLRTEIKSGKFNSRGVMPGVLRLEQELGVNRKTIEVALRQLEKEGLLISQGSGKRRRIQMKAVGRSASGKRVAILLSEPANRKLDYLIELRHQLQLAGYNAFFTADTLADLNLDLNRITQMIKKTHADAWVVVSGAHDLMAWFVKQNITVFALFGRRRGFAMASTGPNKPAAYTAATRELIRLGHRRIVLLTRPRRRKPEPGASEQAFLNELVAHGIMLSPYHLPDWEPYVESYYERLEALFRFTPPTALIIDEVGLFIAAQQFLAERMLRVPQDISIICTDDDPVFNWCRTSIAHIKWDKRPVIRHILRWMEHISHGKPDLRQSLTPAEFVTGGTIGPVKAEQK